jgi:hypothetical protein
MKPSALFLALPALLLAGDPLPAQEAESAGTNNLPPDPFGEIPVEEKAPAFAREVDRTRGCFTLQSEDGTYVPGSHFAHWNWTMQAPRWGNYYVGLVYESVRPKLGVQLKVGDDGVLKSYAPRTNPLAKGEPLVLGAIYLPKAGEYPVSLLTGDQSNVPAFQVKGVHFRPAPESEPHGQSIDGTIELLASTATTYAETLRYEPKPEKDCLGFWKSKEDWAEWVFDVTDPGRFEVVLHYGCGSGAEGSRAAVLANASTLEFDVADTGGFQNWREIKLGTVELKTKGPNRLAIVPLEIKGAALMDVRKVVLTPVD